VSHASLGLWDAHRQLGVSRPLVLSYDGGGNDGLTLAFKGSVQGWQQEHERVGGLPSEEGRWMLPEGAPSFPAMALRRLKLPDERRE